MRKTSFPPAPSERGAWFSTGAALPQSRATHDAGAVFPYGPMDPSKRVCSRTYERQAALQEAMQGGIPWTHVRMASRTCRRAGVLHMAGMAKQPPLPKHRHYRNPAGRSNGASSRPSGLPRAWVSGAKLGNGRNCCGLEIEIFTILRIGWAVPIRRIPCE